MPPRRKEASAYRRDPNSSDRVNDIMREAYRYIENTPASRNRKSDASPEIVKKGRRNPIKCGKARIDQDER